MFKKKFLNNLQMVILNSVLLAYFIVPIAFSLILIISGIVHNLNLKPVPLYFFGYIILTIIPVLILLGGVLVFHKLFIKLGVFSIPIITLIITFIFLFLHYISGKDSFGVFLNKTFPYFYANPEPLYEQNKFYYYVFVLSLINSTLAFAIYSIKIKNMKYVSNLYKLNVI